MKILWKDSMDQTVLSFVISFLPYPGFTPVSKGYYVYPSESNIRTIVLFKFLDDFLVKI